MNVTFKAITRGKANWFNTNDTLEMSYYEGFLNEQTQNGTVYSQNDSAEDDIEAPNYYQCED